MSEVPEDVRRLAEERAERRRAKDFAAADALRDRIAELGYEVLDGAGGWDLQPLQRRPTRRLHPKEIESVLDEAPDHDFSVHWLVQGWPEDVVRGIESFRRHQGSRSVQHVVVEALEVETEWPDDVEVIALAEDPGFGAARNVGLRRSRGRFVVIADGSVEATGDPFAPLEATLADPSVGLAGPFGIATDEEFHHFHENEGPEVDAIEGYLMALRRELLDRVSFDEKFRFYRTADVDLSFQVKDLRLKVLRIDVPVRKHEHRMWESTSEEDRRKLSRKNFYLFRDRFRGRTDLLVERGS